MKFPACRRRSPRPPPRARKRSVAGTIVHALFIAHALFMARALRVALPAFIAASVGSGAMAGELSDIATAAEGAAPDRKPVVGLVLAGGGARGAAHVGVLKVLEELGIHPDLVVGTSMGAIVGGLYATGLSAERLEQIIRRMDWDRVFADDPGRRDRTMRRKQLDREFVIPRRLGFNRTGVQVPLGALHGQHLDTTLKRVIGQTVTVQDFDQLPIRFRAIATDIATGDAVILRSGSLVQALRASMSVPAVFAPVMIDGRLLVDGGLAMNTPVEVAKEMGADIVIVVDLSLPLLPREEIDSMLRVTEQLSNFLTRRNTQASLALLTDDDLLIRPELGNITSIQFERSMEALVLGETAARDALVPLQQLADRVGRSTPPIVAPSRGVTVEFIELNNTSRLDDAILLSRLSLKLGDRLDIEQLESDLNAIYALDVFDAVRYDIVRDPGQGAGVMISADARTWGPNYLQFGLALSSDFDAIQNFSIGSVYTRNAMNRLGADLRVSGAIGRFAGLEIDWYQPLDLNAAWFVQPVLHWNQDRHDLYDGTRHIGTAEIERWGTRLGAGRNLAPKMQVRADYRWAHEAVESISGNVPGEFTGRHRVGELALSARYDSLNNIHFPTRGNLFELTARRSDTRLDGDIDYNQMELTSTTAWTRGRWSLLTRSLIGVSSNDEIPLHSNYRLGGFGRLSGLPPDSLLGRNTALFAVSGQRRIADLRLLPIYAGMSIEGGNLWEDRDDMAFGDLNYSASLYLGIDSFLGPWYLSYGIDDNGNNSFYFYLGNPFELRRR